MGILLVVRVTPHTCTSHILNTALFTAITAKTTQLRTRSRRRARTAPSHSAHMVISASLCLCATRPRWPLPRTMGHMSNYSNQSFVRSVPCDNWRRSPKATWRRSPPRLGAPNELARIFCCMRFVLSSPPSPVACASSSRSLRPCSCLTSAAAPPSIR